MIEDLIEFLKSVAINWMTLLGLLPVAFTLMAPFARKHPKIQGILDRLQRPSLYFLTFCLFAACFLVWRDVARSPLVQVVVWDKEIGPNKHWTLSLRNKKIPSNTVLVELYPSMRTCGENALRLRVKMTSARGEDTTGEDRCVTVERESRTER